MNKRDAAQIIALMQANYPDEFRTMSEEAMRTRVNLWAAMFADESFETVKNAVAAHMASDTSRYMPPVGVIKNMVVKMTTPEEMTEAEAWGCVVQALRNSAYNSAAEFAKLPPAVQRAVGSAVQLREWAMMDSETINSVVASNFQRSYKARAKSDREFQALPSSVRGFVAALAEKMGTDKPALTAAKPAQLEAPAVDPKAQSTILLLDRYRDNMPPERYTALREQAMRGDSSAVLQELRQMLAAPKTVRREA